MAKRARPAAARATSGGAARGEKLYYRIGEVSRITGVKPYVLRYWESEFRWMAPGKSRSQQRLYRQRDIDVILMIKKLLYDERFTIAGARKRLRELGVARAAEGAVREAAAAPEPAALERLQRIRSELESIRTLLVTSAGS